MTETGEIIYEGYCENLPFSRGDKIRIRRGAMVLSTHPDKPDPYPLSRSQVVTVHHTTPGESLSASSLTERDKEWLELKGHGDKLNELYRLCEEDDVDAIDSFRIHTKNPRVVWRGTGKYWFEADVNDVEDVDA